MFFDDAVDVISSNS